MPKRLIIISLWFQPKHLTPVHRIEDLLTAAINAGINVILITRPWSKYPDLQDQVKNLGGEVSEINSAKRLTIYEVPVRKTLILKLLGNTPTGSLLFKMCSFTYSLLYGERINQDFGSDFISYYSSLNKKIIFSKTDDLVYISSPPFSLPKKLQFLKAHVNKVFFEFRDLPWYPKFAFWNGNYFMHLVWRLHNLNPVKWVKHESIVTVNQAIASLFPKSNRIEIIPNFGETYAISKSDIRFNWKEIVYSGRFFKLQDPNFLFFRWIIENEEALIEKRIKFVFYDSDIFHLLPSKLNKLKLSPVFEIRDRIPLADFRHKAQDFYGFLYFDYSSNPFISSTKAWDLANSNLPVFCFNMQDGEALRILEKSKKVKFLTTKNHVVADFLVDQLNDIPPKKINPRLIAYTIFLKKAFKIND